MMKYIETDPETNVDVFQLTDFDEDIHNVYGEQPLTNPASNRILVKSRKTNDLYIFNLENGEVQQAAEKAKPAWHAWSDFFYYRKNEGKDTYLYKVDFNGSQQESYKLTVAENLPLSQGTVSCDGRFYAVAENVITKPAKARVHLFDLETGQHSILLEKENCFFKHEQFCLDNTHIGDHYLMLQVNFQYDDTRDVKLGLIDVSGNSMDMQWLPVSYPNTMRCSGHQCWVNNSNKVILTVMMDESTWGNVWIAEPDKAKPHQACRNHTYFGHISASYCGKYWIADGYHEPGTPVYIGTMSGQKYRRVFNSETIFRGEGQLGHTHLYFTADNKYVIFNSGRTGHSQVYAALIPEDIWKSLSTEGNLVERPAPEWSGDRGGNEYRRF